MNCKKKIIFDQLRSIFQYPFIKIPFLACPCKWSRKHQNKKKFHKILMKQFIRMWWSQNNKIILNSVDILLWWIVKSNWSRFLICCGKYLYQTDSRHTKCSNLKSVWKSEKKTFKETIDFGHFLVMTPNLFVINI